ncbi:MAG: hypothetical protein J2P54_08440, partial [Bradyrhizobiaceae bacterium]|nr:hypothetical protein [Bradyrhizobiaceae bacterium]
DARGPGGPPVGGMSSAHGLPVPGTGSRRPSRTVSVAIAGVSDGLRQLNEGQRAMVAARIADMRALTREGRTVMQLNSVEVVAFFISLGNGALLFFAVRGQLRERGGTIISRHERPVQFWFLIAGPCLLSFIAIVTLIDPLRN